MKRFTIMHLHISFFFLFYTINKYNAMYIHIPLRIQSSVIIRYIDI